MLNVWISSFQPKGSLKLQWNFVEDKLKCFLEFSVISIEFPDTFTDKYSIKIIQYASETCWQQHLMEFLVANFYGV